MINRLKTKILAGFMLLAALLLVAGAMSIYEFSRLSSSVNALIEDNYKTIEASKSMLEALEREDSGILMLILGQWDNGRKILQSADESFLAALDIARGNETETDEHIYVDEINDSYFLFQEKWKRPIVNTNKEGNIDWYNNDIHQAFLNTKHTVNRLMNLNQESLYHEAFMLKEKSKRAIMPGIVAIVAAIIFSLLLNFFISKYFVSPIDRLTKAVKNFHPSNHKLTPVIKSNDELKALEQEISSLLEKLTINPKE